MCYWTGGLWKVKLPKSVTPRAHIAYSGITFMRRARDAESFDQLIYLALVRLANPVPPIVRVRIDDVAADVAA